MSTSARERASLIINFQIDISTLTYFLDSKRINYL